MVEAMDLLWQEPQQVLSLRCPAKVNLFLRILGRRQDGYHNLVSLMAKVTLFDELILRRLRRSTIKLICPQNRQLESDDNLVMRVARELLPADIGVEMELHKSIPIGAGLGGGSSNAAAALLGLNQLFELKQDTQRQHQLAARLGADVPFFLLKQSAAMATGIGTTLRPLSRLPKLALLLVYPRVAVSSAAAYRAFAHATEAGSEQISLTLSSSNDKRNCGMGAASAAHCVARMLHNDLETVVAQQLPQIQELKQRLLAASALAATMSGSGSTVFGLYAGEEEARRDEKQLQQEHHLWVKQVATLSAD